jgi:hypothetical protein
MSKTAIALWAVLIIAVIAAAYLWLNRPRKIVIDAQPPAEFPDDGFSHSAFEELLRLHVTADGRIDYDRWHLLTESRAKLDSYLAAVASYSPDNAPQRFPTRDDELAYWIYGYNAYVIKSVLDHWPLKSVTDVKAPIEAVKGLGFFHQLRFSFGGEFLSLLAVETDKIRKRYKDARIHFVLNCASESCPIARPELPTGKDLETLLDQAAVEFINDAANVSVDHAARVVFLSKIFKWYEEDFIHDLRAAGKPADSGLMAYIRLYANTELQEDLANSGDYAVQFRDYDWKLNAKH